jgi:ribosomal protein S27E
MTIQFECPNCDSLIAFDDKHAGKRARCLTCGQILIIPSKDGEKPKKVKHKVEKSEPDPGFYRAVFVDVWKLFNDPENATSLVFVAAVVCFKFFLFPAMCCGYISFFIIWGWLLGFYLNIIYETAFGLDKLPEIYLGTSITFLWYIIKPFLIFFCTMAAVQLPFIIALSLLADKGIIYENLWHTHTGYYLLLQLLFILGLFLFPMAILTTAIAQTFTMLRPDYILLPVLRAPVPYIIAVALLVAACFLEMQTAQYDYSGFVITAGRLGLNLAVQVIAIIAMRAIGLFYRHYTCYLRW